MHVPPPRDAVRDCMPVLFELLRGEDEASVRAVLGALRVCLYPSVYGRQRPRRPIPDERDAGVRRLPLDHRTG